MIHRLTILSIVCIYCFLACEDENQPPSSMTNSGTQAGTAGTDGDTAGIEAGTAGTAGIDAGIEMLDASYTQIYINEINAKGDPSDWVELYNAGDQAVDLSLCWLSDDLEEPNKGVIPEDPQMIIPPQGFSLILLGDAPFDFKLGSEEQLILSAPNGVVIDQVSYVDGDAPNGASYGRIPDGGDQWKTLYAPTALASNMEGSAPECGDGICEVGEEECPSDCQVCGDGQCDLDEICAIDCAVCGDGQCDEDEECELDCTPVSCGDDLCSPGEECSADCQGDFAIVINEIVAAGDPEDWAELYYMGEGNLDLVDFFMSDDLLEPQKASLQGLTIAEGEFLQIEVSDANLGFKLGKDEALYLTTQNGVLVDFIDWDDGDAPAGQSYARQPDGTGDFQTSAPTPAASNQ